MNKRILPNAMRTRDEETSFIILSLLKTIRSFYKSKSNHIFQGQQFLGLMNMMANNKLLIQSWDSYLFNENAMVFQARELNCNWKFNWVSFIQKVLSSIYFVEYFCRPFFNRCSLLNILYHLFYQIFLVIFLDICNYQKRKSNN